MWSEQQTPSRAADSAMQPVWLHSNDELRRASAPSMTTMLLRCGGHISASADASVQVCPVAGGNPVGSLAPLLKCVADGGCECAMDSKPHLV